MAKQEKTEQGKKLNAGCRIMKCRNCVPHDYQDKRYGQNMRVHNHCIKGARCTVCGTIASLGN